MELDQRAADDPYAQANGSQEPEDGPAGASAQPAAPERARSRTSRADRRRPPYANSP